MLKSLILTEDEPRDPLRGQRFRTFANLRRNQAGIGINRYWISGHKDKNYSGGILQFRGVKGTIEV
jgi:hypothetical protein